MKVELENVKPKEIETRSFEIITEELGDKKLIPGTECIVKRCIHTSADFDYADNLCFSPNAVEKAIEAIKNGACIVTDTQMAKAGINKKALAKYGGEVYCFMSDEDVAKKAKEMGSTTLPSMCRSLVSSTSATPEPTTPNPKIATFTILSSSCPGRQPAKISQRRTPSISRAWFSNSSSAMRSPEVSAPTVTAAQPLLGMDWLMVRIFPPVWAKIFKTADNTPGSSLSRY